ncbi:MAG: cysteine synthase A [Clostridia bacterium]|nr:cysteine synthase A [Clostridia bacterium]
MIYKSVEELIGNSPLVELSRLSTRGARVLAKIEGKNPFGSAKDRIAREMLDSAEREGRIAPGSVIIEPTSGNTGIALAALSAVRGYKAIIVMPDTMSKERIRLMRAYGAEVVLTPGALGMAGSIKRAEELRDATPGAFIPSQFENPDNPIAHYKTTGPEIYEATDGKIDIFVAGIGTGGTITGVGKYLKEKRPECEIIGVEPADSPLITEGRAGAHKIQGIGANFIPKTLDLSVVDRVYTRTTEQAYDATRELARSEGLLVGISSGAALSLALELAKAPENEGKTIVVLLPDGGDKYLSVDGLF